MAEKSLDELTRDLRTLVTKGTEAMVRNNVDYAIDLFNQVLARDPSYFEVRKVLRTAQQKKAAGGGGFFKRLMSSAGSSPQYAKAQLALRKDPAEAMQIAEQILNGDAGNTHAHRIIVEASRALDLPQTAVMSLEVLHRHSPADKGVTIQLAQALANIGQSGRAEQLLSDLYRSLPNDNEVAQALKDLSARRTLSEGGYDALAGGTGSYRDILKDKEEAQLLEQENRQVRTEDTSERLIREYEQRLKTEPRNVKLLRDLADLHAQKKDFDRALAYYQEIKNSDVGADSGIDRAMSDLAIRKYDHQLSGLDPESPEYEEALARLKTEKAAYQLAEAKKRVERFPTDLQLRFELGQLYFEQGKTSEAIQELQRAQNNPHRKVQAMAYLAQCFGRRNMHDLAARTLQNALREKAVFDDEKKELIYLLGCALEKLGKREEAVEQFKQIYEVDIGYKDVAAKVDAYYSAPPGGQE